MASSEVILVNRELTSKLPIKKSGCLLTISSAKRNKSFRVNSLVVKDFKIRFRVCSCESLKWIKLVEMTGNY